MFYLGYLFSDRYYCLFNPGGIAEGKKMQLKEIHEIVTPGQFISVIPACIFPVIILTSFKHPLILRIPRHIVVPRLQGRNDKTGSKCFSLLDVIIEMAAHILQNHGKNGFRGKREYAEGNH